MARHTPTTTGNVSFECISKLDDSALGRFRTLIGSSGEIFHYEQFSHAQSTWPTASSKNSPEELLLELEYVDDGKTIDFSPTASQMGSARAPPKNSSEELTSPLVDSAIDVAEEELLLDIEYNDDGETIDLSPTASETGSTCASPDFNDIDTSDTSPNASMTNVSIALTNPSNASYRLIRPSPTMGPAPFTRPHFVSSSPLPPFSGLHTAIIYATPSRASFILRKVAYLTLPALASMYDSWVVFSYVLWLQSCIILPSLILKHRDAFVVAAVLLGPLLWIAIGYVCSAKVRVVVWVVVWACVGASQVIMVRNWESLILAQEWMRGV
jgi:hypothetical protein